MGALTGNAVQDTYLDLVQLGKSGAGLPSHAGKEAALYDGSGAQILGRSAVRHWLDPDPDAIATSWEFSTMGDMNQAALVTAGWTFDAGLSASVTRGQMILTSGTAGSNPLGAYFTVNLTGDFFYAFSIQANNSMASPTTVQGDGEFISGAVADTTNNVLHGIGYDHSSGAIRPNASYNNSIATFAGGTTTPFIDDQSSRYYILSRWSGTVYMAFCRYTHFGATPNFPQPNTGIYKQVATVADADTYQRFYICCPSWGQYESYAVNFIRRYV